MKWCESCDYLFFRNNYGDRIKLSEKIIASGITNCYSCQCSWINIQDDLISIDKISKLNWTCGGHNY
jgi:hypothetical protein